MNEQIKQEILNLFRPTERWEVQDILDNWQTPGRCALAELRGIFDCRHRRQDDRDRFRLLTKELPPDGFTIKYYEILKAETPEQAMKMQSDAIDTAAMW